jgi:hypothetical protein
METTSLYHIIFNSNLNKKYKNSNKTIGQWFKLFNVLTYQTVHGNLFEEDLVVSWDEFCHKIVPQIDYVIVNDVIIQEEE